MVRWSCLSDQQLLGWSVTSEAPTWVMLRAPGGGAGLSFQLEPLHVPPSWPAQGEAGQMQMHLDIGVDDLDASVQRAVERGATGALRLLAWF